MYFYVYMYICKCINNNVIILLEPVFLVVVNDRAMLAQAQDGEPLLLGGLIAVYLSYYWALLMNSKTSTHLYILHLRQIKDTYLEASHRIFLEFY